MLATIYDNIIGGGRGGLGIRPLFSAINPRPDGTIDVEPYRGTGSATFARTGLVAHDRDFENVYRLVQANEARIQGARRSENLLLQSEDFSTTWVVVDSATVTSTSETDPNGGSTAALIDLPSSFDGFKQTTTIETTNKTATFALWLKGSGTIYVRQISTGVAGYEQKVTLDAAWQRFSFTKAFSSSDTGDFEVDVNTRGDGTAAEVYIAFAQLEDVSGASNTAPSDYIPTTTAAVAKYYWKTNGNSVASNVVTEAAGISLHPVVSKQGANVFARYDTRVDSTAYVVGDKMIPASGSGAAGGNGYWYYIAAGDNGTSDSSEPTMGTTIGGTTVDNGATWTNGGHYKIAGYQGEPAAENVILQSQDFSTTWSGPVGGTGTETQDLVGFNGVANTGWTLDDTDATNATSWFQDVTIADDANTHCLSIFVPKDSDTTRFPEIQLDLVNGTTQRMALSLNTQTGASNERVTTGTVTSSIEDHGLRWRVILTVANNSTGNLTARVRIYPAAGTVIGNFDVSATGSTGFDQAQLELNTSVPSSPIITTTAAVTRNADDLSYAASGNLIDSQGVMLASVTIDNQAQADNGRIISDISANRTLAFVASGTYALSAYDGTGAMASPSGAFTDKITKHIATRWETDTSKAQCIADGVSGAETAYDDAWDFTGIDILHRASGNYVQGTISDIRIYSRDLGQTKCEALTSYD